MADTVQPQALHCAARPTRWLAYALRRRAGSSAVAGAGRLARARCAAHGVELRYIQPGKPNLSAFIERTYPVEVLNAYVFETLGDVRTITLRDRIQIRKRAFVDRGVDGE